MTARPRKADPTVVKPDFKAMLAGAKLPERAVNICLRGDLVADHEAAEHELELAQKRPVDSLAGNGVPKIIARIEALEAEMTGSSYDFRMRALPKPAFRALIAAHPPRRDDAGDIVQDDRFIMSNHETMLPALIRACLVDPVLSEDEWTDLNDKLTDRQFGDLADAAWYVNRGEVDVPFSRAASLAKRTSSGE